jgi:hypothetical protein
MEEEILVSITQLNCEHEKYRRYTFRSFDVINGFEIVEVRCSNCMKTLEVTIRRL